MGMNLFKWPASEFEFVFFLVFVCICNKQLRIHIDRWFLNPPETPAINDENLSGIVAWVLAGSKP